MSVFSNLFKSKDEYHSDALKGMAAYEEACKLADQRLDMEALPFFDAAIKYGYEAAYEGRAYSLQGLERYNESIPDFDKAIDLSPEDCNLYYSRGNSKHAVGNLTGAVADREIAIELSTIDNEVNRARFENVKNRGFKTLEHFYTISTDIWEMDLQHYMEMRQEIIEQENAGNEKEVERLKFIFKGIYVNLYGKRRK